MTWLGAGDVYSASRSWGIYHSVWGAGVCGQSFEGRSFNMDSLANPEALTKTDWGELSQL